MWFASSYTMKLFHICFLLSTLFRVAFANGDIRNGTDRQCRASRYQQKPRLFVITDLETEPDDQMSLVRLLTYSKENVYLDRIRALPDDLVQQWVWPDDYPEED